MIWRDFCAGPVAICGRITKQGGDEGGRVDDPVITDTGSRIEMGFGLSVFEKAGVSYFDNQENGCRSNVSLKTCLKERR